MPDHSSRFYTARLRLSAAVAGAIAAAALALGSGLVPARAVAEEGAAGAPQASEAAKAEAVKRIMAGREFKIMFEYEDTPFCRAFLEDFQGLDVRRQKAHLQTILQAAHVYRDGRLELEFRVE